jgi:hypothetical protein
VPFRALNQERALHQVAQDEDWFHALLTPGWSMAAATASRDLPRWRAWPGPHRRSRHQYQSSCRAVGWNRRSRAAGELERGVTTDRVITCAFVRIHNLTNLIAGDAVRSIRTE